MFNCPYRSAEQLRSEIRQLNARLRKKGLRIVPLRIRDGSALIYVYRPARLKKDLSNGIAVDLLQCNGYACGHAAHCVACLSRKMKKSASFPHEVGLFLGYPPEDVQGFMEQGSRNCKLCGCWKVYGDAERAQKIFDQYKKCTAVYARKFSSGRPWERLTVAARV